MTTLVDDLIWLVDTPSVTGDEEALCTAIARRLLPRFGVDGIVRVGNSVVVGRPDQRPLMTLYGHLDTVPHQGSGPAEVRDGRLHGLGSSDMKAGLAVMLALLEDSQVAAGPYALAGVFYDREEGPVDENGLEGVLDSVPWLQDAEFAVVLEPTDLALELGCQGVINATAVFEGRAGHSARPWLADNAVTRAGAWLAAMHDLQPVDVEVAGLPFKETFAVTTAHGGVARNVIPGRFEVNVNHRFPPNRSLDEAEARVHDVLAAADEVIVVDRAPAAPIPVGNEHLERLIEVADANVRGKQAWTDVARLTARGVPAVNYGPGETAQAHQAGESVGVDGLEQVYQALWRFLGA